MHCARVTSMIWMHWEERVYECASQNTWMTLGNGFMRVGKDGLFFEEGWKVHCMGGGIHLRQFNLPLGGRPNGDYTPLQVSCYLGSSGQPHWRCPLLWGVSAKQCRVGSSSSLREVIMVARCIDCWWKWLSNKPSSFCSVYVFALHLRVLLWLHRNARGTAEKIKCLVFHPASPPSPTPCRLKDATLMMHQRLYEQHKCLSIKGLEDDLAGYDYEEDEMVAKESEGVHPITAQFHLIISPPQVTPSWQSTYQGTLLMKLFTLCVDDCTISFTSECFELKNPISGLVGSEILFLDTMAPQPPPVSQNQPNFSFWSFFQNTVWEMTPTNSAITKITTINRNRMANSSQNSAK